jgi:hypothetical protein
MAKMAGSTIAYVTSSAKKVLKSPVFIIKVGTVYYVTKGLWEYDPAAATTTKQVEGVALIKALYDNMVPPPIDYIARERPPGGGNDDGTQTNPGP